MESIVEEQHPEIEPKPKPRVIKRRRPEMPLYDPEMQLRSHHLFSLKSLESGAIITKVTVSNNSIVVGTQTGKILVFEKNTLKSESYQEHTDRITDIWVEPNKAIVSVSHDQTIFVKCLGEADFIEESIKVSGYNEKFECVAVID